MLRPVAGRVINFAQPEALAGVSSAFWESDYFILYLEEARCG